jgi:hypothetical protein
VDAGSLIRPAALAALLLALPACGYNAAHTASRQVEQARTLAAAGDSAGAAVVYASALDAAASSYRTSPAGRWSGEALLLAAEARLGMGHAAAAAAAAALALHNPSSGGQRARAHALLGEALLSAGDASAALPHLDSALAGALPSGARGAVMLHRGRALLEAGRPGDAWADLAAAAVTWPTAAARLMAEAALQEADARRFGEALLVLSRAHAPDGGTRYRAGTLSELQQLTLRAAARLGSHATLLQLTAVMEDVGEGDVATSLRQVQVRLRVRTLLDDAATPADLDALDTLPASDSAAVTGAMLRAAGALRALAADSGGPDGVGLFAAAELARDALAAPALAWNLFIAFADVAPGSPWAGKAVLAAHAIRPDDQTRLRLDRMPGNVYVRAAYGHAVADELHLAEQRLARQLAGLLDFSAAPARKDPGGPVERSRQ